MFELPLAIILWCVAIFLAFPIFLVGLLIVVSIIFLLLPKSLQDKLTKEKESK